MALPMTRPYAHPKTGVYWVRKAVPEALRPIVGKRELVHSLGTKDPKEARIKAPIVLAQFEAVLGAARADGGGLTLREITALAAEWYRSAVAEWGDDPDKVGDLDIYEDLLHEQVERRDDDERDPTRPDIVHLRPADLAQAEGLLRAHRYPTDPHSVTRVARAIFDMKFQFITEMRRRLNGDWTPDGPWRSCRALAPRTPAEAAPKVTLGPRRGLGG